MCVCVCEIWNANTSPLYPAVWDQSCFTVTSVGTVSKSLHSLYTHVHTAVTIHILCVYTHPSAVMNNVCAHVHACRFAFPTDMLTLGSGVITGGVSGGGGLNPAEGQKQIYILKCYVQCYFFCLNQERKPSDMTANTLCFVRKKYNQST